ncbi:hypothetical protein JCM3774_002745 [Rhodotorula dairenensis]
MPSGPPPALCAYVAASVDFSSGRRLCRPGVLARRILLRPGVPLLVIDVCLGAVNHALASYPKSPSFGTSIHEEGTAGLESVVRDVIPAVVKSPTSTPEAQRWLLGLVRHVVQASKAKTWNKDAAEKIAEALRAVLPQLDTMEAGVLRDLKNELQDFLSHASPRRRRRVPAAVDIDDGDLTRRGVDPDAALYCTDLLLHPYSPISLASSRLAGLLRYRTDQAAFRGSTAERAAAILIAEVAGSMIWSLHTAIRHDFLLESLVYAKSDEVLVNALRMARSGLETSVKGEHAQADDTSAQHVWEHLVFSLCREGVLPATAGATLVPTAESADLEAHMVTNLEEKVASSDAGALRAAVEEHMHMFGSQHGMAQVMLTTFRDRSESADITGLADLCEVLMALRDELAVMFLHVEPRELLRPVRQLLDATDPSQDDANDSSVMERYGMLVLFLQITVKRFQLGHDLAKHLDSTTSFFVSWLRATSAVYTLTNISDEERHTISGWIGALFGEGISDELMHSTNPKVLLKVAPTILKQSLMACRAAVVDQDSLRDALSYFLQELLRFTLPGVLVWLLTEIEQTSTPAAKNGMIDILQIFCHSASLPPAVLELVAPHLAASLQPRGSLSGLEAAERLKLLKLIAPYHPRTPILRWDESAAVNEPSAHVDGTKSPVLKILDHPGESGQFTLTAAHRDAAALLRTTSSSSCEGVVRAFVEQATANDLPDETQPEGLLRYGRLERAGSALCAWQPWTLEELIREVDALHSDETKLATIGNRSGRTAAVLADILAGSLTFASDPQRRRMVRRITAGIGSKRADGVKTQFWDRLQSWPAISSLL